MRIWHIFAAVIILPVIGLIAWISYVHRDQIDTFYILNASLNNPDYLYDLEERISREGVYEVLDDTPSVYSHRLKHGDGAVFAYRWFSEGRPEVIDDEGFEKITIWVPEIPRNKVSKFDISNRESVIVVYTKGGSAWPSDACAGYLDSGQLIIRRKGKRFVVTLEGTLHPLGTLVLNDWCTSKIIANEFQATEIERHELTTWLGKRGSHPYDETYR